MKPQAVFVETNWVVDIVAPAHLQSPQVSQLLSLAEAGELMFFLFLNDLYKASRIWVYRDFLVEDVDELPQIWFSYT